MQKDELNRLRDEEGRPPGVIGWWPSRATTFLENHDTVSCFICSLCIAVNRAGIMKEVLNASKACRWMCEGKPGI